MSKATRIFAKFFAVIFLLSGLMNSCESGFTFGSSEILMYALAAFFLVAPRLANKQKPANIDLDFSGTYGCKTTMIMLEHMKSFTATGLAKYVQWIAHENGPCGHGEMDNQIAPLGGYFTLPTGENARFPYDPKSEFDWTADERSCSCAMAVAPPSLLRKKGLIS